MLYTVEWLKFPYYGINHKYSKVELPTQNCLSFLTSCRWMPFKKGNKAQKTRWDRIQDLSDYGTKGAEARWNQNSYSKTNKTTPPNVKELRNGNTIIPDGAEKNDGIILIKSEKLTDLTDCLWIMNTSKVRIFHE